MDPSEAISRLRAAFGGPEGYRTLHAKGRFYSGTFTATPEATALCRAGHLDGAPHPVLLRWSSGSGNGRTKDPSPDIRGMAVKFAGDDGRAFDLLGQTATSFPTQDPAEFVRIAEATRHRLTFPLFVLRHPRLLPSMVRNLGGVKPHHSFAEAAFFPLHAYGWLDAEGRRTWVRYEFRPTATPDDRLAEEFTSRDRLAEEIAARLARGPVVHEVWVQLGEDRHDADDVTTAWKGARTLLAGRVEVTAEAEDPEAGGSPTVFDPTRTVDGIELPNDPILLYRRDAYTESVSRRTS
jgi:catalase